jgi:hypothetical protein
VLELARPLDMCQDAWNGKHVCGAATVGRTGCGTTACAVVCCAGAVSFGRLGAWACVATSATSRKTTPPRTQRADPQDRIS